jgi:hypothetical protein
MTSYLILYSLHIVVLLNLGGNESNKESLDSYLELDDGSRPK